MAESKRLELKVTEFQAGAVAWNYEELEAGLTELLKPYAGTVYDVSQMGEAKNDRAALNRLSTAIAAERKRLKADFMAPFTDFETKCKTLETKVKEAAGAIDKQVKEYEEDQKARKKEGILAEWANLVKDIPVTVEIGPIWNERWLNKTFDSSEISKTLNTESARVHAEIKQLTTFTEAGKADWCIPVYLKNLDMGATLAAYNAHITELKRAQALKAEAAKNQAAANAESAERQEMPENRVAEIRQGRAVVYDAPTVATAAESHEPADEQKIVRALKVRGTVRQLFELADYMKAAGIEFMTLKG